MPDDKPRTDYQQKGAKKRTLKAETSAVHQVRVRKAKRKERVAEPIATHLIPQHRTLQPIPEPMQSHRETEIAGIDIGSSQQHACQKDIQEGQELKIRIEEVHQRKRSRRDKQRHKPIDTAIQ